MSNYMSDILDSAAIKRVEFVGDFIYVGVAPIGTLPTDPKWSIKRIDTSDTITVLWADGSPTFDKIMSNYASYAYS